MPSNYVVLPRSYNKWGVFWGERAGQEEQKARFDSLVSYGWPPLEAAVEVKHACNLLKNCTENPEGYSLDLCLDFVVAYAKPEDTVIILPQPVLN